MRLNVVLFVFVQSDFYGQRSSGGKEMRVVRYVNKIRTKGKIIVECDTEKFIAMKV